jgi:putative membrane protein
MKYGLDAAVISWLWALKVMNVVARDEEIDPEAGNHAPDLTSSELASRRTALSFQRTRMSADRTLMSVIRTSLSLIGFGFTIYQFFRYLRESVGAAQIIRSAAPRNFGLALVTLGVAMLSLGIWKHVAFMLELRAERKTFADRGLIPGDDKFPVSVTLIMAALLLLGLVAIVGMVMRAGPFH